MPKALWIWGKMYFICLLVSIKWCMVPVVRKLLIFDRCGYVYLSIRSHNFSKSLNLDHCGINNVVLVQVLLQRGVVRLTATRDYRHVCIGRAEEEAERPADPTESRDSKRCAHHQLSLHLRRKKKQFVQQCYYFVFQQCWQNAVLSLYVTFINKWYETLYVFSRIMLE